MNVIARDKVAARNEARALADAELAPAHSRHILRVEAIIAETIDRLDTLGRVDLSIAFAAELHTIQAAHARLTLLAKQAGETGDVVTVMGGER